MYTVQFTQSAHRDLLRLPAEVIRRIIAALERLAADPRGRGTRKLVGGTGSYRLRVGEYRVIYSVQDAERIILVTRIRHRKDVYQ
jgi:mRNA interferase RelE/StbE